MLEVSEENEVDVLGCCYCYVRVVMLKVSEENEINVWGFKVVVKC